MTTEIRYDGRAFKSGFDAGEYARKITTLFENGDDEQAFDDALNAELDCLIEESNNIDRSIIDSFINGFGDV